MRLLLTILLAAVACFAGDGNQLSGRRAPGFSLPDSEFRRYDLQDYRGKWVLIEFINTNCPFCKELSQTLEQIQPKYQDKVEILAVVLPPDNMATVARYIQDLKLTYPLLFDQGQMAASYFNASPANPRFHTPHLFVVDPKGTIVRDFGHGEGDDAQFTPQGLSKALDDLLSGKAAPAQMKKDSAGLPILDPQG